MFGHLPCSKKVWHLLCQVFQYPIYPSRAGTSLALVPIPQPDQTPIPAQHAMAGEMPDPDGKARYARATPPSRHHLVLIRFWRVPTAGGLVTPACGSAASTWDLSIRHYRRAPPPPVSRAVRPPPRPYCPPRRTTLRATCRPCKVRETLSYDAIVCLPCPTRVKGPRRPFFFHWCCWRARSASSKSLEK
jgi:hypothetical protein